MKIINKIFLFISILSVLSLGFTTTVFASTPEKVIISDGIIVGDHTLKSGESIEGDMVTFGGNITIEDGATIYGSMAAIGGNIYFDGEITGDLVCIGGSCNIGDTASIGGSLVIVGSSLDLSNEAIIIGEHVFIGNDSIGIPAIEITTNDLLDVPDVPDMPDIPNIPNMPDMPDMPEPPQNFNAPDIIFDNNPGLEFLQNLFSITFTILALSAMALLVGVLFPKHLKKTAATVVNDPVRSGVLGLLTISVAPIAIVILGITIILIPVSLLLAFALVVLVFYGWVAVGYELGDRIANAFKTKWDVTITAGIGTLALSTLAVLIGSVPCVGFLIYPIVIFIGLGGVFISQFGSREVKPAAAINGPTALPDEVEEVEKEQTHTEDQAGNE